MTQHTECKIELFTWDELSTGANIIDETINGHITNGNWKIFAVTGTPVAIVYTLVR